VQAPAARRPRSSFPRKSQSPPCRDGPTAVTKRRRGRDCASWLFPSFRVSGIGWPPFGPARSPLQHETFPPRNANPPSADVTHPSSSSQRALCNARSNHPGMPPPPPRRARSPSRPRKVPSATLDTPTSGCQPSLCNARRRHLRIQGTLVDAPRRHLGMSRCPLQRSTPPPWHARTDHQRVMYAPCDAKVVASTLPTMPRHAEVPSSTLDAPTW
jgi:hypothetical protein